jgi:1-deoxy-D-xylulose-5-phosphate synthase
MRFVKPLDGQAVLAAASSHEYLVTVEENALAGGAGSAVNEWLAGAGQAVPVLNIGLADEFMDHGTREQCLAAAGLDEAGVLRQIEDFVARMEAPGLNPGQGRQANA